MPPERPDEPATAPDAGATDVGAIRRVLALVASGHSLSEAESEAAFSRVMDGEAGPAQVAALLMGLRVRGETVAEMVGAARAMRARMRRVAPVPGAIDVCGTGGDGHATLNVSTAVAFVLAALGVPVAKHGNRAVSSRAGASDTLEALGIPPEGDVDRLHADLLRYRLAFLAAPLHHPAMRHAAPVRAELGLRTLFNLLGPLCNPAGVTRQVVGVFDAAWQQPLAQALLSLGVRDAWVVHGGAGGSGAAAGIDELALEGENHVVVLGAGGIRRFSFAAEALGLAPSPISAIRGGDASHNAAALERLLRGEPGPYRDVVLLNAAAALIVAAPLRDDAAALQTGPAGCMSPSAPPLLRLRDGMAAAARALDDGSAFSVLEALRRRND